MSDNPYGYSRDLSSFGGLPLATIQGVSAAAAAALMRVGIHDAEHLLALAALSQIKPYVAVQLGSAARRTRGEPVWLFGAEIV